MVPFTKHHLFTALEEYENQTLPLDLFLNRYFRFHKAIGSKDRAFISNEAFALIRWKGLLKVVAKASGWEHLHETYQSAQFDELKKDSKFPPFVRLSCPEWLYGKLAKQYGEEKTEEILLASNTQAPSAIRANLLKTTRENLFERLVKKHPVTLSQYAPTAIVFSKRTNYFNLEEYVEGLFEVQDEGSQLLADLVQAAPQNHVLDFCAGSGGKALAIAPKLKGTGQIYLHDVREKALLEAKKRLRRAGVQNVQWTSSKKSLKGKMDWILVDAPCSGTGTFRRNPDMKWRLTPEEVDRLTALQREIFEEALSFLKPSGKIVYATCSLLTQENEEQVDYFIQKFFLKAVRPPLKLLPTIQGPDGFFGAVLEKSTK
ncbi:MAG: RsmB/NOP family class I SAM-dependent RNA methyltransferase [Parachlamydiaceae bacterium]